MWSDWEICWPSFSLKGKNIVFICSMMIQETYHKWTYLEIGVGRGEIILPLPQISHTMQNKCLLTNIQLGRKILG
jgi:hypothetical protein